MELQQAFDDGFDALKGYVDRSFDAYARRIQAMEQKILAMEAHVAAAEQRAAAITYRGVWSAGVAYAAGNFVTHNGSLWCSTEETRGVEPDGGSAWRLAAKRGRDGRDAAK